MNDTPSLGISWCPGCEPERDPSAEILEIRRCDVHHLDTRGSEDETVTGSGFYLASNDVEGEGNRRWCQLVHRGAA